MAAVRTIGSTMVGWPGEAAGMLDARPWRPGASIDTRRHPKL
jgi:hypothetical protein